MKTLYIMYDTNKKFTCQIYIYMLCYHIQYIKVCKNYPLTFYYSIHNETNYSIVHFFTRSNITK